MSYEIRQEEYERLTAFRTAARDAASSLTHPALFNALARSSSGVHPEALLHAVNRRMFLPAVGKPDHRRQPRAYDIMPLHTGYAAHEIPVVPLPPNSKIRVRRTMGRRAMAPIMTRTQQHIALGVLRNGYGHSDQQAEKLLGSLSKRIGGDYEETVLEVYDDVTCNAEVIAKTDRSKIKAANGTEHRVRVAGAPLVVLSQESPFIGRELVVAGARAILQEQTPIVPTAGGTLMEARLAQTLVALRVEAMFDQVFPETSPEPDGPSVAMRVDALRQEYLGGAFLPTQAFRGVLAADEGLRFILPRPEGQ